MRRLRATSLSGSPYVRFDNAHGVERVCRKYVKVCGAYDNWHQTEADTGRPYAFTSVVQ